MTVISTVVSEYKEEEEKVREEKDRDVGRRWEGRGGEGEGRGAYFFRLSERWCQHRFGGRPWSPPQGREW